MSYNKKEQTIVGVAENYHVAYEKKTWWIFSWFVQIKRESLGKDLIINTEEKYDRILLNGKEINQDKKL